MAEAVLIGEMGPDVLWHDASTSAAAALETHVESVLGRGDVASGRLCPACGSARHGRPWLRHDGQRVHVSLSRAGTHLVTAIAAGPVGVDVEAAVIDLLPELVLAPGETESLALAWVRKEAILKMRGTGLRTPMRDVVLAQESWKDLAAPEGYVAALAVAGTRTDPVVAGRSAKPGSQLLPIDLAKRQLTDGPLGVHG